MDEANGYESIVKRAKRAMNPDRENRRQNELTRMATRFIYVAQYQEHSKGATYLGHRKISILR